MKTLLQWFRQRREREADDASSTTWRSCLTAGAWPLVSLAFCNKTILAHPDHRVACAGETDLPEAALRDS
jgi:hypothetical protein